MSLLFLIGFLIEALFQLGGSKPPAKPTGGTFYPRGYGNDNTPWF